MFQGHEKPRKPLLSLDIVMSGFYFFHDYLPIKQEQAAIDSSRKVIPGLQVGQERAGCAYSLKTNLFSGSN